MTESDKFKVTIEGEGLSVERHVSAEIANKIVVLVLTGTRPTPQATDENATDEDARQDRDAQAPSFREFLNRHEAKRMPDKITALAYFLRTYASKDVFSRSDLISRFESAAERIPKNLSRDIKWAMRVGWIAQKIGEKDAFYLTNDGESAVEAKFPKQILKKTRQLTRSTRKARKKKEKKTKSGREKEQ